MNQGGYHASELLEDGKCVYVGHHGLARYCGAEGFYRLVAAQDSEVTGRWLCNGRLMDWPCSR